MASISGANLTLTTVGSNVTIGVTYTATFTEFERSLANLGLRFRERIRVIGIDPPGGFNGTILPVSFGSTTLPVTPGPGPLSIPRNRTVTVPRSVLQEDTAPGDADEIRCEIIIEPVGMPASVNGFTDQEVLLG